MTQLKPRRSGVRLKSPGWNATTRRDLQRLIRRGAGKKLPVVFDFDNTLVCGDIGEAVLAVLARDGVLSKKRVPKFLCPPFHPLERSKVRIGACRDIVEYYEALQAPTVHGVREPAPLSNAYVWATQILAGLRPSDVVKATRAAFAFSQGALSRRKTIGAERFQRSGRRVYPPYPGPFRIEVTPGRTGFPAPFFYDEMVELLALLQRNKFEVWIVSASNVWSVRWMVLRALNPRLRALGARGLRAENIIGISTLLADGRKRLFKDSVLVRENPAYAALNDEVLRGFRLTSLVQMPIPTYSGKVACILDRIGRQPWLAVGDGRGDHAMLAHSKHRLWIARLEKPDEQRATIELRRKTGEAGWMLQPVLSKHPPQYVPDLAKMRAANSREARESIRVLSRWH